MKTASSKRDQTEDILVAAAQAAVQRMKAASAAATSMVDSMRAEEEEEANGDSEDDDVRGLFGDVPQDEENERATWRVNPRVDCEQSTWGRMPQGLWGAYDPEGTDAFDPGLQAMETFRTRFRIPYDFFLKLMDEMEGAAGEKLWFEAGKVT